MSNGAIMDSAISNAIACGAFTRPHGVAGGLTCYDVDKSWRGMNAFLSCVNPFDFGGNDEYFMPLCDGTPMRVMTYGRWLCEYRLTKHVVVDTDGRVMMYEYRRSASDPGTTVWSCAANARGSLSPGVMLEVDAAVTSYPVRMLHETPSWTDGSGISMLMNDMDSDDEDRRAAVASRFYLTSGFDWALDSLSADPSTLVKAAVMRNMRTRYETVMRLLDDPDWRVRMAVCERMAGADIFCRNGGEIGRRMCADPEPEVRMAFLSRMYECFFTDNRHRFAGFVAPLLDGPSDDVAAAAAVLLLEA